MFSTKTNLRSSSERLKREGWMTIACCVTVASVEAWWLVAGPSGMAAVVEKAVFSEEISRESRVE
jgi:hypothetical protein